MAQSFVGGQTLEFNGNIVARAGFNVNLPAGLRRHFFQQLGQIPIRDRRIHAVRLDLPIEIAIRRSQRASQTKQRGKKCENFSHPITAIITYLRSR